MTNFVDISTFYFIVCLSLNNDFIINKSDK